MTGVAIPQFESMLEIAARSTSMTGLGYVGVDLVLDRTLGPLMLELNARPGLAIQIANRAGLATRLARVDAERVDLLPPDERIAFARAKFAHVS